MILINNNDNNNDDDNNNHNISNNHLFLWAIYTMAMSGWWLSHHSEKYERQMG